MAALLMVVGASGAHSATVGAATSATGPEGLARQAQEASNLRVVGYSDLGGGGLNGEVAVVGTTAVVAAGVTPGGGTHSHFYNPYPCPAVAVKVVDLTDPASPVVAAAIPLPVGIAALDVDARRVSTTAFSGDLAAVALASCGGPNSGIVDRGVAYYDVTNPSAPAFLGRYLADFDQVPPTAPPCGPGAGTRCASSQHSVSLVQRPDGRVLSLSTEPFASPSNFASGDLRIVDVTNPRNPVQVGAWPPLGQAPAGFASNAKGFSNNGCRPFDAAHAAATTADGRTALVAYLDNGLYTVDLSDPAAPGQRGQWDYPAGRGIEGNAAYVSPAAVGDRSLALLAEEDWIAPTTSVRIDAPATIAGNKPACEAMFTLFDPEDSAAVFRKPGSQVGGEFAYLGRGCPAATPTGTPDPYPAGANPAGKIAVLDRGAVQVGLPSNFCTFAAKSLRAQQAGAIGAVVIQTTASTPEAFSPDGVPPGLDIPVLQMDKADGDALRTTLCPNPATSNCAGGQVVGGALVDGPGEWGGLRVLDVTDPGAPAERGAFRTPRSTTFPPPDLGVYSVHHAVARGTVAYAAWNSDGLRVLDLATPTPRELASFVPADTPDPSGTGLPAKALVVGVAPLPGQVVITDVNSGLYVLQFTGGGYLSIAGDGGVFAFGDAPFLGSTGDLRLNSPIVGTAATPTRRGYWLVAADGGIFSFGDADFFGSTGDLRLSSPVVGMQATPTGRGYWLVAADGGIFSFGDADFFGSTGDLRLNSPVVGMATTPNGRGYWLVAADGGIFSFGEVGFFGSTGDLRLNSPVVDMTATATGRGYWMVAADGGIFTFGDGVFQGSMGGTPLNSPMVAMESFSL